MEDETCEGCFVLDDGDADAGRSNLDHLRRVEEDMPVIVTNVLALVLQASIMVAKLKYEKHG
jgi:hypothetical protein